MRSRRACLCAWILWVFAALPAFSQGRPPSIASTSPLPGGQVGIAYSYTLQASGGQPPLQWSVTSGSLPPGLALNPNTGNISGIPLLAGDYTFRVTVTDSLSRTANKDFSIRITILPQPAITTTSLPAGTVGAAYSQTLAASGGTPPYSWSIASGSLPTGLALSTGGAISGTPTTAGTFSFTVQVTDSASQSATQALQILINPTPPAITTSSLPAGTVGTAYSQTLAASGGTPPYSWSIASGSLPTGLALSTGGAISGTPTTAGTFSFTVQVTDSATQSATQALQILINPTPPAITTTSLPAGTVGAAYSQSLSASGGTPPYSWVVTTGSLPAGLALSTGGAITGTPTAAGTFSFTVQVTDSANQPATQALQILINPPPPAITTTSLPAGTVGVAYSQSLGASGGTPPYSWVVTTGSLPTGLALSTGGAISGTPTTAGTFSFTVQVTDSANQPATQALQNVINPAPTPPTITTTSLPAGTVGVAYSQSLAAAGGTPPYAWAVTASSLPAGLALSTGGAISGTPTTAGTFSFTVQVTDSANQPATQALQIVINPAPTPPTITTTSLPAGTLGVAYSQSLAASGGTPPYSWSIASGSLPQGLALSTGGAITGTPTAAGTFAFTARVTDSTNQPATQALQIVINPAPTPPTITTRSLPAGTVGVAYSQSLAASGGTPPYSWSIASGSLPAGLALSTGGAITGTPTAAGTFAFTARVTDSASQPATQALQIVINPAATPPTITTTSLPAGTLGVAYSQSLTASGGTPPYSWSIASGSLPAGLALSSGGAITGTPATAGSFSFTARVRDSSARSAEKPLAITVVQALSVASCPGATGQVGIGYSSTATAAGGTPPYTWSFTSGPLPQGLALTPSTGTLSGTPVAPGAFSFTLQVADAASRTATRACTVTVTSPLRIVTLSLPDATTQVNYAQSLAASGGTPPYRWSTSAGSLPPGLALDAASGAITGLATQPGSFTFTVSVLDAAGATAERGYTITVAAGLAIPACPFPTGTAGRAYSSTLTAIGGQNPYAWSIASGSLPDGLRLAADSGIVSGTPSAEGTSAYAVRVTDARGAGATRQCSIAVAPQLMLTTSNLAGGRAGVAYTAGLTGSGGTPPYVWTVSAGALPPGLSMNAGTGQISGVPSQAGAFSFTARVTDSAGVATEKAFTITIVAGFSIATCPEAAAVAGQPYSSALSVAGGEPPFTWSVMSGALPAGLALSAANGTISGTPAGAGTSEFTVRASDAQSSAATRACSIVVGAPGLRILSAATLPDGSLGDAYEQRLTADGGRGPYTWTIAGGALPDGLVLSDDGSLQGSPTATGRFQFTIQAADQDRRSASQTFTLRVLPAQSPRLLFLDLPEIVAPAQQPAVKFTLDRGYPVAIRGVVVLRFTPDPGLNVDDPAVRFMTGERSVEFDIPANSTEPVFPVPQLALQTGTVAGTIELAVLLAAEDLDVTPSPAPVRTIRVDRTAPVITSVRLVSTATGFEVQVIGFSTTREVSSATFQFTPAAGSRIEASELTIETNEAARLWFQDPVSAEFGGQFRFVQPFTVQGATVSEVGVTLTNAQGTSSAMRARF